MSEPLDAASLAWWGVEHTCGGERREYPVLHWADEPEEGAGPRQAFECDACGDRYAFHEVGQPPTNQTVGAGRAVQDDGLPTPDIERLQAIQDLQPNAVAYMRQRGYVMDVVGPLPDDAPELDRWKVLAFSLYTDLVQASTIAEQMLTEAYRGAAPPLHNAHTSRGQDPHDD